jgi:LacI family transcriptional regulator
VRISLFDREFVEQVLSTTHPVVVVNAEHPELAVDTFLPDNWRALCQAVHTLIQRGHRRILHVTYAGRSTLQRREQAYCAALADLQESGLRVPADVSVIGFDDVPLASLIVPPLTTMRIERKELGSIAVRRLIERAVEPQLTASTRLRAKPASRV